MINYRTKFSVYASEVLLEKFKLMMSYKDGTISGNDIEDLHQMRVTSRRLRAAMETFAICFPDQANFKFYLNQIKEITEVLGKVRDLDVMIERINNYLKTVDDKDKPIIEQLIIDIKALRLVKQQDMRNFFEKFDQSNFEKNFIEFLYCKRA